MRLPTHKILTALLPILMAITPVSAAFARTDSADLSSPAETTKAQQFIQSLGDKAITIIGDKSLTEAQRTTRYRELLEGSFDLTSIGHFVLGRAWNTATPDQQQEFTKLFRELVINLYSDRLSLYAGETFHTKSARPESERDITVNSEIQHPDGSAPSVIDWRVRTADGKLAVIDVVVQGVSQSVTQRQEYGAIIQRNGGNIEPLLDLMRQRVQQAHAGTQANG